MPSEGTLDSLRRELRKIDLELAAERSREQNVLKESDAVQQRLAVLEQVVRDQQQLEQALKDSIALLERDIAPLENRLSGLGSEILTLDDEKNRLAPAVARSMMARRRLAGWATLEFLIGSGSWTELLSRRSLVERMEQAGRRSLMQLAASTDTLNNLESDLVSKTTELRTRRNALEASRQTAAALRASINRDLTDLANSKQTLQIKLSHVQRDRGLLIAQRDEIASAYAQIAGLIDQMVRGEPVGDAPFGLLKGSLPWPAKGRVIQRFGLIRNRDLATVTENPGIELDSEPDAEVRCVADGRVSSVSWLRGFGNVCIIEHSGGYFTVYARLGQVIVHTNDTISSSQLIGYPGYDPSSGAYRIHFEVWSGKEKKDPLTWLKKQ